MSKARSELEQLYAQRRARLTMPKALQDRLTQAPGRRSGWQRWQLAAPMVLGSMVVLLLIWPNGAQIESQSTPLGAYSLTGDLSDSSPVTGNTVAGNPVAGNPVAGSPVAAKKTSPQPQTMSPALSPMVAESALASPITASATAELSADRTEEQTAETALLEEIVKQSSRASASTEQVLPDDATNSTNLQSSRAKTLQLRVIDGAKGLFQTCAGEAVILPEATEIENWVEASALNETDWQLLSLPTDPC